MYNLLRRGLFSPQESFHCEISQFFLDALYEMSPEEKALIWKYRIFVRNQRPYGLAKVLLAAPSSNNRTMSLIHSLVASWPAVPPVYALEVAYFSSYKLFVKS